MVRIMFSLVFGQAIQIQAVLLTAATYSILGGRLTTIKILTETAEPIWANQINIYPNPTTDKVFIDAQNIDIQSITVFDMVGKQVQNIQKSALSAPLSIPTAGTYFIRIETNKGAVMKKIVKM